MSKQIINFLKLIILYCNSLRYEYLLISNIFLIRTFLQNLFSSAVRVAEREKKYKNLIKVCIKTTAKISPSTVSAYVQSCVRRKNFSQKSHHSTRSFILPSRTAHNARTRKHLAYTSARLVAPLVLLPVRRNPVFLSPPVGPW